MNSIHRAVRRIATLVLASTLAAGLLAPADVRAATYPAPVTDFGHFDSFPDTVGTYHRGEVATFAPDMIDFSIGYSSRTTELDSTVTLFFYPHHHATLEDQLLDEEQQVLRAHAGARVLERRHVMLTNARGAHDATLVTFAFQMPRRDGGTQPVASELLLVFRDKGVFMVRSTGPEAQGPAAEAAMLALVQRVDWQSIPGR